MALFFPIRDIRPRGFDTDEIRSRRLAVYLGISICVHVLFFLVSIWLVDFRMPYKTPEVVQVDLVSFAPGEPGGPAAPKNAPDPVSLPDASLDNAAEPAVSESTDPPVETVPEPEPVAVLKPDLSLKSKPDNLKELMAKKPEPKSEPEPKPEPKSRPAEPAPENKPETPPEKKEPDSQQQLAQAMERLAKTVKEQDKTVSGTGTGPVSGSGTGGGTGRKGGTPLDFYKMVLQSTIQQNWVFNEMLAGLDQNMEVRILIKILKNGEIRDIIYETRSGNPYLDQSAKRAIQRANPLPALPPGMASYDVVVIFTPKGLK
ncbi:MAG: TonB family protein [Desulfotignum sp.]|nr:TonB family protein [Desulfotignum sp.]MCF8086679.1 TonB family protein [Desulfotignum sp.]MCF8136247.1 TonB family protein [Desulfotignum sp.]